MLALCNDANACLRLQARGIENFSRSRLEQLYHALENPHSAWYGCSQEDKQAIRNDIRSALGGKVNKQVTLATMAAKEAALKTNHRVMSRTVPELDFVEDHQLRKILRNHAPHKPYCCDNFALNAPRKLETALRKRYIQLNPPGWYSFIICDLDYADAGISWKKLGLPPPTWVTINPKNGHAHLVYALSAPIWCRGDNQKPAKFFEAVQSGFWKALGADEGFACLLTKNPVYPDWITVSESEYATYDLADLAKFVKLDRPKKKKEHAGIGRNCMTFDELRFWAYPAVAHFDDPINFSMAVQAHVEELNFALAIPMSVNEVLHIARSVAKYTWRRRHALAQEFSARQSARGRASGKARREKIEDKRAKAIQLHHDGHSVRDIAAELNTSKSTVQRWV